MRKQVCREIPTKVCAYRLRRSHHNDTGLYPLYRIKNKNKHMTKWVFYVIWNRHFENTIGLEEYHYEKKREIQNEQNSKRSTE